MPRLPPALRPWWPQVKIAYTTVTGGFAPVSQRVARLRDGGGPTGVAATAEEAVSDGGRLWVVREAHDITRPVPPGEPAWDHRFRAAQHAHVPRVAVALLPEARVDGRFGGVITRDGRLAHEFSNYFGTTRPREHPQFLRPLRKPPVDHGGTVAVLADRGDDNYYHFLVDVIPKLALLADCPDLPDIDGYYVPANRAYQRELLELFGVRRDQIIDSRETQYLRAAQLVVPGLPDAHLQTPRWVVDYLRGRLLANAPEEPRRRLYLTRGGARNTRIVLNEAEVLEVLRPLGFELFDSGAHTVVEQVAALANAEAVVAPHGAALTNLAFVTGRTRVVELFAPDYVNVCYWALSSQIPAVDYRYVLGSGKVPAGDPQCVASDIIADTARLRRMVDL